MNTTEAKQLTDGLIWMPADINEIHESTLGEFPFRTGVYADIANTMEDLAILQRRRQREFMIDESSEAVQKLGAAIQQKKDEIHHLFIPDFDVEDDSRIMLTPYENYDMTGKYDITQLEKRFRNSDEHALAFTISQLAGYSSEHDEYVTRNSNTLQFQERIAGMRNTNKIIADFRKQLAMICGNDELRECLNHI